MGDLNPDGLQRAAIVLYDLLPPRPSSSQFDRAGEYRAVAATALTAYDVPNLHQRITELEDENERLRAIVDAAERFDRAERGLEAMPCADASALLHQRRQAFHALRAALAPREEGQSDGAHGA